MATKYIKRKDGRYRTRVSAGYDSNGRRVMKAIYGKTIRELEAKLVEFKSLQNKGVVITDNKITLAEWSEKWLKAYKQGVAYNTYEMYRTCVENHIATSDIARLPLAKIKNNDLQALINKKQDEGLTRTVEIIAITLKQIFKKAIKNQLLYVNPADDLELPTKNNAPKRALTDFENHAIDAAPLTDRERAFIYFGKYTGLRRGEIIALTKGDIDLLAGTITVNKTVVFKNNTGEIKNRPKSHAGFRTIPMPQILHIFIRYYLSNLDGLYLFATQNGDVCTRSSMRKLWESTIKKINEAAGGTKDVKAITGLTPHILRHDYATNLYYAGVDIKTAQKLLGHSDIKMTLQIYTHLEQDNDDIKDKLNKIYGMK